MLKKSLAVSAVVALLSVSSMAKGYHGSNDSKGKDTHMQNSVVELSLTQQEGLLYLVEEEKVARDVYLYLSEKWGANVFVNIAKSEQKHMDAVAGLLSKYNIELPITLEEEGTFTNETLQALYDSLIEKGDLSLDAALEVGVTIEETDIEDIENLLNQDITQEMERVYERLLNGSYNHLNAFRQY